MGGRGGSSSLTKSSGLDVTIDGKTTRYYFTKSGGTNYYQRGIGDVPQPTPLNMSAGEFKKRVENNGAVTKNVSAAQKRADERSYKKDREETDRFLDYNNAGDKHFRKGTRAERIARRATRRRR